MDAKQKKALVSKTTEELILTNEDKEQMMKFMSIFGHVIGVQDGSIKVVTEDKDPVMRTLDWYRIWFDPRYRLVDDGKCVVIKVNSLILRECSWYHAPLMAAIPDLKLDVPSDKKNPIKELLNFFVARKFANGPRWHAALSTLCLMGSIRNEDGVFITMSSNLDIEVDPKGDDVTSEELEASSKSVEAHVEECTTEVENE